MAHIKSANAGRASVGESHIGCGVPIVNHDIRRRYNDTYTNLRPIEQNAQESGANRKEFQAPDENMAHRS
jgi:hypothetical protein